MNAQSLWDREFLEMRCRLIDLAASMDRLERAEKAGGAAADPRMGLIRGALELLAKPGPGRAERMQLHFSDPYRTAWREELGV